MGVTWLFNMLIIWDLLHMYIYILYIYVYIYQEWCLKKYRQVIFKNSFNSFSFTIWMIHYHHHYHHHHYYYYYYYLIFSFTFSFLPSFTRSLIKIYFERRLWLYIFYTYMVFTTSFGWYYSVTMNALLFKEMSISAKSIFLYFLWAGTARCLNVFICPFLDHTQGFHYYWLSGSL